MKPARTAGSVLVAGMLTLTAACGGSEAGSPDTSGSESGTTTLSMAETPGAPFGFVSYGVERGHFADEGIDLQLTVNPGGGTSTVPALLQGDFDVMGLDLVSALTTIEAGLPLRMVSAGSATSDEAEGDFSAVLVPADSPIQGPADYDGVRMGVNALLNVNELYIQNTLEAQGMPESAISPVELPFPDILGAIARGDVDAGIVIEPFATIGQSQGMRVVDRPWHAIKPGLQIGTMVMTEQKVAEDPDVAERFARAVQATADDVRSDPAAFRAALPDLIEIDPALAEQMNLIQWRGASDRESIELTGQLMTEYGLIDAEIDYDEVIVD
ncbi:ABC transporter substrate-binding protein [Modestobacter lapidis]|nr:ABC transporter substrate-binding protein [Modestobacter lapidis]